MAVRQPNLTSVCDRHASHSPEVTDGRPDSPGEIVVFDLDGIAVGASVEHDVAVGGKSPVDEYLLSVQRAQRRHGPELTIGIQTFEFTLARESDVLGASDLAQTIEIHKTWRRHDRKDRTL